MRRWQRSQVAIAAATLLLLFLWCVPAPGRAQSALDVGDVGYELTLASSTAIERGAAMRLSGVGYEVAGLWTLVPREGLEVVAEIVSRPDREQEIVVSSVMGRTRVGGRFDLELAVPDRSIASPRLVVRLRRAGSEGRTFSFPIALLPRERLDVSTDRDRYEPGETIHVWIRTTVRRSRAPLADLPVEIRLTDPTGRLAAEVAARSSSSGAVTVDLPLSSSASAGAYDVEVRGGDGQIARRRIEVLARPVERLLVAVELEREVVAPAATLVGRIRVTTPSGMPVRGASVSVWARSGARGEPSDGAPQQFVTDGDGLVTFSLRAPSFASGEISTETLRVRASHPAHGFAFATRAYVLARSPWQVAAVAENGALVPELEQDLFLSITDARRRPIGAGHEVVVRGPGIASGSQTARTDARGLAEVRVRLPRGAATRMVSGPCAHVRSATTFHVEVQTRPPVSTRVCVPVSVDALVSVRASRPVVDLGGAVEVEVARRQAARGRAILLELFANGSLAALGWLEADETRGVVRAPSDLGGGVWTLRARALTPPEPRGPLDAPGALGVSTGSSAAVLARPADAFALSVSPERASYRPRENATVVVTTSAPPARPAWAALVVRDEAMHAGESDWVREYVEGELREAMRTPFDPADDRFLRATLAAGLLADDVGSPLPAIVTPPWMRDATLHPFSATSGEAQGLVRDAVGQRELFARRRLGAVMVDLERRIDAVGVDASARARWIRQVGSRLEFASDALERLGAETHVEYRALGGRPLTVAMLAEADPSFTFDNVARRVARRRLVRLLVALAAFGNPSDPAARRASANEPPDRWLARLVELGVLSANDVVDPWGRPFALRRARGRRPTVVFSERAIDWELASPGPDGVLGNADDIRDPFARVVPRGSLFAVASGEDRLLDELSRIAPGDRVLAAMARAYGELSLAAEDERRATRILASASQVEDTLSAGVAMDGLDAEGPPPPSMEGGRGGLGRGGGGAGGGALAELANLGRQRTEAQDDEDGDPDPGAQDEVRARAGRWLDTASALVREEFPATLRFVGEVALASDGRVEIPVPLRDALTTYRLEAIAWTNSGWITSARGALRVEQDVTVDAPVPRVVHVGDALRLPVRLRNRTGAEMRVRVEVALEGVALQVEPSASVTVPARDAIEGIVELRTVTSGSGGVVIRALAEDGSPLDAIRRPLIVLEDSRMVRLRRLELVEDGDTMAFEVPRGASSRGPGELRLTVAGAAFGDPAEWIAPPADSEPPPNVVRGPRPSPSDGTWAAWALAMRGERIPDALVRALAAEFGWDREHGRFPRDLPAPRLARLVGAFWADERFSDEWIREALRGIAGAGVDAPEASGRLEWPIETERAEDLLLGLAPAASSQRRAGLRPALGLVVERLAAEAANRGARVGDDVASLARVAAALASSGLDREAARARELARRAERDLVVVGDAAWLEGDVDVDDEMVDARLEPTAALALALVSLGEPRAALPLMRSLFRAARSAPSWSLAARALATAAATSLTRGRSDQARARLDGALLAPSPDHGVATFMLPAGSTSGQHRIEVGLGPQVLALASLDLRVGVPWNLPPVRRAPIELAWDGEVGARETRAGLRLTVRNTGTRVLARPIIEIQMPAGAELDEESRIQLSEWSAGPPTIEGATLRLTLRPIAPGGFVRLPVPLRWSVGGRLRGLGVVARDESRLLGGLEPSVAVLASREVVLPDAGSEPPAARAEESAPPRREPPPIVPMPRPLAEAIR